MPEITPRCLPGPCWVHGKELKSKRTTVPIFGLDDTTSVLVSIIEFPILDMPPQDLAESFSSLVFCHSINNTLWSSFFFICCSGTLKLGNSYHSVLENSELCFWWFPPSLFFGFAFFNLKNIWILTFWISLIFPPYFLFFACLSPLFGRVCQLLKFLTVLLNFNFCYYAF